MVGYFESFILTYHTGIQEWNRLKTNEGIIVDFLKDVREQFVIGYKDIGWIVFVAVVLTILRYLVTRTLLTPFVEFFNFKPKDKIKFPESFWKFIYYSSAFAIQLYLVMWKYPEFLADPRSPWIGWSVGMPIQDDIYFLYILEAGFYVHAMFGTLFMDFVRKDFAAMIFHHCLAFSLIIFSMAIRYHRIGLLVLFFHDINDVLLEFTKMCICFKNRTSKPKPVLNGVITVGFLSFSVTWFWCRLYLYPLFVLYSAGHVARSVLPTATFYFFFNMKLWLLFFLNIWWFHFIVWLIIRIVTGKSKNVEDTRELSDDEREDSKKGHRKDTAVANGDLKNQEYRGNGTMSGTREDHGVVSGSAEKEARRRVVNGNVH